MALLSEIIKKYETEANQRIIDAREKNGTTRTNREDLFLKTEPRGDPVGKAQEIGLGSGSPWKAKPIELAGIEQQKMSQRMPEVTIMEARKPREQMNEAERLEADNRRLSQRIEELEAQLSRNLA